MQAAAFLAKNEKDVDQIPQWNDSQQPLGHEGPQKHNAEKAGLFITAIHADDADASHLFANRLPIGDEVDDIQNQHHEKQTRHDKEHDVY
jgi:hypothetical protein